MRLALYLDDQIFLNKGNFNMSNFSNSRSMNNTLLTKQRGFYHVKVERYRYGRFALNEPNFVGFCHFNNVFGCTYFKHNDIGLRLKS